MLVSKLFTAKTKLSEYRNTVWRVVQSLEEAATLSVVDEVEEQMLLQALPDEVKPAYRKGTENMHSIQERWQWLSKPDVVSFSSRVSDMGFIYLS